MIGLIAASAQDSELFPRGWLVQEIHKELPFVLKGFLKTSIKVSYRLCKCFLSRHTTLGASHFLGNQQFRRFHHQKTDRLRGRRRRGREKRIPSCDRTLGSRPY